MRKRLWRHYRNLPPKVRRILVDERLRQNVTLLERAWREYPTIYAIPSTIANLLVKRGRLREGLRVWRRMVKQFPNAPNPYFERAHWSLGRRDFEEAQKYLRFA